MEADDTLGEIGKGTSVFENEDEVRGTIHYVTDPEGVIQLIQENLSDIIGLVRAGNCSFASPLLTNSVSGLITLEGAPQSHLGIISREYNIPCIMSIELNEEVSDEEPSSDEYLNDIGKYLDGKQVRMDTSTGAVYANE